METEAPNPGSIDDAMSYPSIDKGSEESFMRSKHEFNPGDIKITATSPRNSIPAIQQQQLASALNRKSPPRLPSPRK